MKAKTGADKMPKKRVVVKKADFDRVLGKLIQSAPQKRSETKPVKKQTKPIKRK
jgi:hypothetical protein